VNASSTAGMIFMDVLFLIASFSYSFFPFRVLSLKKKKLVPPPQKKNPNQQQQKKTPFPVLKLTQHCVLDLSLLGGAAPGYLQSQRRQPGCPGRRTPLASPAARTRPCSVFRGQSHWLLPGVGDRRQTILSRSFSG